MIRNKINIISACLLLLLCFQVELDARENVGYAGKTNEASKVASDCDGATAFTELNVNNVRARINTGGDLWWEPPQGANTYEVPKVEPGSSLTPKQSLFAGALWIGGFDDLGQLKVAAHTYRQSGNDFYPGPLNSIGEVDQQTCIDYDKFWEVGSADINAFLVLAANDPTGEGRVDKGSVPESILKWPARNNPFFADYQDYELPSDKDLAPFWDNDGDGDYDPTQGDYPVIDSDVEGVYGDQMIWWVFNDKGNAHTETGGEAIGLEIRALAFAFATNDEVNNMTFYKYVLENNSSVALDSTYLAQWVDPDLGEYQDDFVGCDTTNSIGIVYNGDPTDEGTAGYGDTPPMLGVDFFKGPDKPTITPEGDTVFVELGMSSFLYYNNDGTIQGNPQTVTHFYGYLSGTWQNGTPFTFGGNGLGGTEPFPYMFPDDPSNPNGWSECAAGNTPADRRFLQAAGPFRLEPGAVNDVIVGVVWVPDVGGCPVANFSSLLNADKKAQALFDNNFKLIDGPDAPNMTIREQSEELIISIWNPSSSNNFNEAYAEPDPVLATIGKQDSLYKFQGYRIFQLANAAVSPAELNNPSLAREIATVDINDGVTRILNYVESPDLGGAVIPTLMVDAKDSGIEHTFVVTEDQFATTGNNSLINHKRYYFTVIAYAYNAYTAYDPNAPFADDNAQRVAYLAGRNNVRVYTAIPHRLDVQYGGIQTNAQYGDGPEIEQLSGYGNGCNDLELSQTTIDEILSTNTSSTQLYEAGQGPINVSIYDPVNVPPHEFLLTLKNNIYTNLPDETDKGGTLREGENGQIYYEPEGTFSGYDHFNYTITDGNCIDEVASVVINVNASDLDYPGAFDDTRITTNTSDITIDVLANDVVKNASIVFFTIPTGGELVLQDNQFIYTKNDNFTGLDVFTYRIADTLASGSIRETSAKVYINAIDLSQTDLFEAVDDVMEVAGPQDINPFSNDDGGLIGGERLTVNGTWLLQDLNTGEVYRSEGIIKNGSDQSIGGWEDASLGFTISIQQAQNAKEGNGFISADITGLENLSDIWLGNILDEGTILSNWILSGEQASDNPRDYPYDVNEFYEEMLEGGVAPYCLTSNAPFVDLGFGDITAVAPACFDCYDDEPIEIPINTLDNLHSVDIVYTSNKDLWSRCPVIELGRYAESNERGGQKNGLRRDPSWNRDGSTASPLANISDADFENNSYFIGGGSNAFVELTFEYEKQRDTLETIRDNFEDTLRYILDAPTKDTATIVLRNNTFFNLEDYIKNTDGILFSQVKNFNFFPEQGAPIQAKRFINEVLLSKKLLGDATLGGDLQIYNAGDVGMSWFPGYAVNVETGERLNMFFSENSSIASERGADLIWNPTSTELKPTGDFLARYGMGGEQFVYVMSTKYDQGADAYNKLFTYEAGESPTAGKKAVYDQTMWVAATKLASGASFTSLEAGLIPKDITMRLRVKYPYTAEGNNTPLQYKFNMAPFAPSGNEQGEEYDPLEYVKVVPNPYYAFSAYENNKLDNRIKITNLPPRATVRIFSLDGTLIRELSVDNTGVDTGISSKDTPSDIGTIENALDWDLKNFRGIPVASGMYIIHIEDPNSGKDKTIKWFGVLRPVDLDTF